MRTTRTVVALAVAAVLVVVTAGAATAGWLLTRGDAGTDRGTCGGATWELSVEREDGGHEASFELQSAAPGETWSVVRRAGRRPAALAPSGPPTRTARSTSTSSSDPDGSDAVTAAATYDGRTCSATTSW